MCLNVFYATSAFFGMMFVADYLSIFYLVSKIFDQLIFYEILTGNILEETEKLIVISYNNCKK